MACLIRVPVEIAKQRRQTLGNKTQQGALQILWSAYKMEGLRKGVYRGFSSTIMREIPFSLIQFPLWEFFKLQWSPVTGLDSTPFSVALCGAVAGGISAGLTTPLDVVKTRIMLAEQNSIIRKLPIPKVLSSIYKERGIKGYMICLKFHLLTGTHLIFIIILDYLLVLYPESCGLPWVVRFSLVFMI